MEAGMVSSRTALFESLLAWMEQLGASFDWIAPTHWGC
jgi:hypothetical protein